MRNSPSRMTDSTGRDDTGTHLGDKTDPLLKHVDAELCVILLLVPVLLTVWVYYGKQAHLAWFLPGLRDARHSDVFGALYEYATAFLLMFLVPWLVARIVFHRKRSELGLQLGDTRYGFRAVAVALPVALAVAYMGSLDPAMQVEYPIAKSAWCHLSLIAATETSYLVYYLGWEFLFRGWMLMGLERHLGALPAILVQTIPSALVHIGKPASESFASIAAGVLFGFLAYRTKSILYPLLLHAAVGIGTDVIIGLRLP